MKYKLTLLVTALFFVLWLGENAFAGTEIPGTPDINVMPVDTGKKKVSAPAPPAQMLTFPLSLKNKLSLSGYSQARYVYGLTEGVKVNTFDLRRARIDLRGNIGNKWAYRSQWDFAPTVRMMDGTVSFTANPYFKVTAGQQKIAFSLENIISSPTMESINRSQVVEALVSRSRDVISADGNNNGRDIGVILSGGIPIAVDSSTKRNIVEYYAGVYNGNGINKADNNVDKDFGGRLLIMPIQGLSIGGSVYVGQGSYGSDITQEKKRNRFGGEVYYLNKWISFKAEFIQGIDDTITKNGYYAQLAGFAIPNKLQFVLKYDVYDANTDKDENIVSVYTFGANFIPNQWAKLQVAYDVRKEQGDTQTKNDLIQVMLQLGF